MSGAGVEARSPADGTPVVHVHLKVVPGAARDGIVGGHGDRLRVRVRAPAESGKANQALVALLAEALGLPQAALTLVRGRSSAFKTLEVRGLPAAAVGRLLYGEGA